MKHFIEYIKAAVTVLVLCLPMVACTDDPHDGGRGIAVALEIPDLPTTPVEEVTITITADDRSYQASRTFTDMRTLAATLFDVPPGCYTVTAATPDGLGGKARTCIDEDDIHRVTILLTIGGAEQPVLRLNVTLPDASLPPYGNETRSVNGTYTRRFVADVFTADGGARVTRCEVKAETAPGGTTAIDLPLDEGMYDIRLWSDYVTEDGGQTAFYDATDLQQVNMFTGAYTACTDYKDAAYAYLKGVSVTTEGGETSVALERPLAKYRIVAKDIERYKELEGLPPLEELTVNISYEGFFPSSFNVVTGKPNDAAEGISYTCTPSWKTDEEGRAVLATDWVFVNGTESSVRLTVTVTASDGTVVSRTNGVNVPYKRGRQTTVSGNFLTAGHSGGGVDIDTSWDDDSFEVEF